MSKGCCLRLLVPGPAAAAFEDALAVLGGAVVTEAPDIALSRGVAPDQVEIQVYLEEEPEASYLAGLLGDTAISLGVEAPDHRLEALPDVDWVAESQSALPPVRAGRFYIFGSHVTEGPPAGHIPLQIEANAAFGTGRHETTSGCLIALSDLAKSHKLQRVLDMGCGSGVLAMAAARLWPSRVTAVDNDPIAVAVARENARINGLTAQLALGVSEGYQAPLVREGAPYHLIIANILAQPLCHMARDLHQNLSSDGLAILSGLLQSQEAQVLARHRALGLKLVRRYPLGEWVTLVIRK